MMKKTVHSGEFSKSKQMNDLAVSTMDKLGPGMVLVLGQYMNYLVHFMFYR